MSKKLISIILSCVLVASLAVVGVVSVSAAIDNDGRYVPSEGVTETHRIYFFMPESWKSEKFNASDAGAYWWNGADACESKDGTSKGAPWPGYKMQVYDADANLFYVDLPADAPNIIFNNFLNGGEKTTDKSGNVTYQFSKEQFEAAAQTKDMTCQFYSAGDDDYYDNMLDGEFWTKAEAAVVGNDKSFLGNFKDNFFIETENELGISMTFDNMIFVIDPENYDVNELSGKLSYGGNFYFLYGKNADGKYEYGGLPDYEMAKENGVVHVLDKDAKPATPIQPNKPQVPDNNNGGNNNGGNNNGNNNNGANNNGANNNGGNNNGGNTNPTATVPAPDKNATSSADSVSTSDTTPTSGNGAVQTGVATAAAALAVVLIAGGAVLYTRKRFE
ncbi:hypothetical protein [Ruminococcus bromii]|uniref:hypothetical protein n=1 Tax=Ruminococcus bromii TaxID=40518 RepID=UPI003F80C145